MKLSIPDGALSCVPLKLIQMRRSVLNRMVQEGNWDIVGRGRDHHPLASDDQELLSAIAQLNSTANSTQYQKRNVTSVTSAYLLTKVQGLNHSYDINASFAKPAMIPFISDSDDFVYVLVHRVAYLAWKEARHEFTKVALTGRCHVQQNIDQELSRLVTF